MGDTQIGRTGLGYIKRNEHGLNYCFNDFDLVATDT